MVKLLKRINGKICVQKENRLYELIELEKLVHAGSELLGFNTGQNSATVAQNMALVLGKNYGCDYVLIGANNLELNKSLRDIPNYVYIATFYHERKKATLKRIK